jgi:hypothetical protein
MLDAGIKGERLVRGEPTEVREVRALMRGNVEVLELVIADVIKSLIDGGQMDPRWPSSSPRASPRGQPGAVPLRGWGVIPNRGISPG